MSIRYFPRARQTDTDQRFHFLRNHVSRLLKHVNDPQTAVHKLNYVESLLAALPLASSEFAAARQRLRNARRYLQSCELGAAKYELRLLLGGLKPRSCLGENPSTA